MVELHNNLEKLEGIDIPMYIVSKDTPDQQFELYHAIEEKFGTSLPFISDPDFQLIESMGMRNGDVAYRGYGMIDQEGNVVFKTVNDFWGEEIDKTVDEIKAEYRELEE
ncbi:redoxin domain-containing protein [Bacillus sp. V3B]|nr:redoxin domain-containing protein [Bacillus sp. V3B]